jgi:hypothetical protein
MGMGWQLDAAQLETYRRDGLVVSPHRFPDARLAAMRGSLDRLLRDNATTAPESLICPHIPNGTHHDTAAAAQWFEYATDPGLLDLVEQVLGPDVILWGSQVFCKPARTGRTIPWHQDGQYWPIRPIATCSVWIALDDATPENGCMRYVPGSHAAGSLCSRTAGARARTSSSSRRWTRRRTIWRAPGRRARGRAVLASRRVSDPRIRSQPLRPAAGRIRRAFHARDVALRPPDRRTPGPGGAVVQLQPAADLARTRPRSRRQRFLGRPRRGLSVGAPHLGRSLRAGRTPSAR